MSTTLARDVEAGLVGSASAMEEVPSSGASVATLTQFAKFDSKSVPAHTEPMLRKRDYLRAPGLKQGALITVKSLVPKDWLLFAYFLYTIAFLFIGVQDAGDVVWLGILVRLVVTPLIIFGRYYLAVVPDDLHKRRTLFRVRNRSVVLVNAYILGFVLDIVHILCAVYFYTEQGKIIANVWDYPADFWDDRFKEIDHQITGVPIEQGVGFYLRSLTSAQFNRALGEYLSMCYVFFYLVIALGYVVPYAFAKRYNFDQITTGMVMAYLICLSLFPLLPTAGPYWAYPDQRPTGEEIGYFFGPLSQSLIEAGSSIGTAFPSSHCAITTATQVLSLVYFWPLGLAFLAICPAIVFATIWLGNHYVIDSLVGVSIGLVVSGITIIIGNYWYPKVEKPLTGYKMYIRAMLTFPALLPAATSSAAAVSDEQSQSSMPTTASGVAEASTRGGLSDMHASSTMEDVCIDVDEVPVRDAAVKASSKPAQSQGAEQEESDIAGEQR